MELTKALIDRAETEDLSTFMRGELLSATLTQIGDEAKNARATAARSKGDQGR
ncbi:hypothetical protein D3C85_1941610 [compost metagenome]